MFPSTSGNPHGLLRSLTYPFGAAPKTAQVRTATVCYCPCGDDRICSGRKGARDAGANPRRAGRNHAGAKPRLFFRSNPAREASSRAVRNEICVGKSSWPCWSVRPPSLRCAARCGLLSSRFSVHAPAAPGQFSEYHRLPSACRPSGVSFRLYILGRVGLAGPPARSLVPPVSLRHLSRLGVFGGSASLAKTEYEKTQYV